MIFLGDTHGNNKEVQDSIDRMKICDNTIFHVGDFCIGFTSMDNDDNILRDWDDFLRKRNITMYVTRGNHDNPDYFEGYHMMDNLKLIKDYSVIECEGKKVLCVGGAISIDRILSISINHSNIQYGIENRVWWKDEIFVYKEDIIKEMRDIDIVVTHTSPSIVFPDDQIGNWPPLVSGFFKDDELLEGMLVNERVTMTEMHDELVKNNNITNWFYGHFHQSKKTYYDDITFRCLKKYELYEIY